MTDARNYNISDRLKNGTDVTIRAIRADDKQRILKAFGNLDSQSVYTRFFAFKSGLTEEELKLATEVDFENTIALVVTVSSAGGEEAIIGAGRYMLYEPLNATRGAEIAFTVEEDYHGQGIAGKILKSLVQIAREKGVSRFEAEVLPNNRAMLAVFARSGLPMTTSAGEGVTHVSLSLQGHTH